MNYPFDDAFPTISKCSTFFCFCWGVDCKCICSLLANFGGSGQSKKWERAIGCERIWEHHPHHPHHPRYLLLPSHHSGGFASFNLHPLSPLHSRWRRTNILKQEKIHEFHTRWSLKWPVDQWKIACWLVDQQDTEMWWMPENASVRKKWWYSPSSQQEKCTLSQWNRYE